MFSKTLFMIGLLLPFLLIATINTVNAVEGNKPEVVSEANEEQPKVESKAKAEPSELQNNTNVNDTPSIKMIVGGQSKDGVAKSINLPVNAK